MKIESNGEEKITVTLSHIDMSELDITYDEMDYSNIETRRVIWTILDKARKSLGRPVDTDGKLLIEVAPLDDGGCVLHFTSTPASDNKHQKRMIMKKEATPLLFYAYDENAFIDAMKEISKLKKFIKSAETYKYKNCLYIIIRPHLTFTDKILHTFCEFGNISACSEWETAKIYEYGKFLS